jgi:hypothetical protein
MGDSAQHADAAHQEIQEAAFNSEGWQCQRDLAI